MSPTATDPLRPQPQAADGLVLADIMSRQLQQVDARTPLGDAASLMDQARVSSVVVTDGGLPVGILTENDMLRLLMAGTARATPVGKVMSTPLVTAKAEDTFTAAWGRMGAQGLRHLLVVDGAGQALGLVSETDFRNRMDTDVLKQMGSLSDLLERELPELPPTATMGDALQLMVALRSTYVLVTQAGRALGIVTERDVPRLIAQTDLATVSQQPLRDVANSPLHTVPDSIWVVEAVAQMQRLNVRHLVVENGQGQLVGVVQLHRLMARLGEHLQKQHGQRQHVELERRSRRAEDRLALAANAARIGFWEIELRTDKIKLSNHTGSLGGLEDEQGDSSVAAFLAAVADDDRARVQEALQNARQGVDTPVHLEYRIAGRGGQVNWFNSVGKTVSDDGSGHPTHILGATMDITERKQEQARLIEALALLQQRKTQLEHLSHTIERSPVVAVTWRAQRGKPLEYVSNNVSQWGYQPSDFRDSGLPFSSWIHPDDRARVKAEVAAHVEGLDVNFDQSYRLRAADGHWVWVEDHTWIERDASGDLLRIHGVLTDVTTQKWMAQSAATERAVLEQLAKGDELPGLLTHLALSYEALIPDVLCSVMLLDPVQRTLKASAAPSVPPGYLAAIDGTAIGPAVGSCGTAAHTGKVTIAHDIATDPLWADYREPALAHGLAACWSVPIIADRGRVLGTFAVYARQPKSPTAPELQVIERGAYLAGLAIERDNNQQTLRKLSLGMEQSPNAIIITDLQGEIEYANHAFYEASGYTPDEVLGKNPKFLRSGKTPASTYAQMWTTLANKQAWKGEFINHRKDGSEYIEAVRISPVHQPDGSVTHYLAIKEDITRQKQAEQQIYRLAYFDVLTGLPNRQLLADRFAQAASMAKRLGGNLALMFLDLDHFKNINDTLGHSAGDELLMQAARRLESLVREGDTLSRQGGDEFVLVLPGCDAHDAQMVAAKLVEQHNRSFVVAGQDVVVTLSVGIAMYPNDGTDFEDLSKSADVAMYQAKQAGRNTFRFFKPDMQARSGRTLMLENSLRYAMDNGQLELVYQPQVSLTNGQLVGMEALLRWRHPELGMVSPAEFIPLAEAGGQILRIGEWVMRTAAQQLKDWMDQGMDSVVMAVNLSAVQFRDPGLAATVARVLHDTQLPPNCLELELTESVAMGDPLGAVVVMDEIHALNVSMSIDDFGTGYSSLGYLKRFKVGKLKIDQSFVRDITTDPDDKAIVSAIIGLASNMGLRTIAEGVETPGQLAWLRLQGCDEAQGYFFNKPLPPGELLAWINNNNGLLPSRSMG